MDKAPDGDSRDSNTFSWSKNSPITVFAYGTAHDLTNVNISNQKVGIKRLKTKLAVSNVPALPNELRIFEDVADFHDSFPLASMKDNQVVLGVYQKWGSCVRTQTPNSFMRTTCSRIPQYEMVVLSNPVRGREDAYNEWYDKQHLPDVLNIPGFISAQRYIFLHQPDLKPYRLPRYAAHFKLESSDFHTTVADIEFRISSGITRSSPDFDFETSVIRYYRTVELGQ